MSRDWWLRLGSLASALALLLLLAWQARPDGLLRVHWLATDGDAALIELPTGGVVLLDGGADPPGLALALGQHMPFWQRRLEAVILTLGDEQRLPGQVAALARYRAGLALAPVRVSPSPYGTEWLRLLRAAGTPVYQPQAGQQLVLGGVRLTVRDVGDGDTSGLVVQLDHGTTRVLFAGAAGPAADVRLLPVAQPVTLLIYPWQREPRTPLLRAWQPRMLVFSTGQRLELPAAVSAYGRALGSRERYARLYHPDLNGTVTLVSNGQQACVRTERCSRLQPACAALNARCAAAWP